tara:strand:+ start:832 stop:1257 length:426 start_codon:yes stop_codon:yes gene_type:complete
MSKASDLARLITSGSTAVHGEAGVTASGSTGNTTNLQQGLLKVWGTLDGTGTIAIRDSFNVASADDVGTGLYDFNYTTNMGNDDYCITVGVSETTATDGATNRYPSIDGDGSTSDCRFGATYSGSNFDVDELYVQISGDLS